MTLEDDIATWLRSSRPNSSQPSEVSLAIITPRACFDMLARVAETFGWSLEDAAHIVFLRGLDHYGCDRRGRLGGVLDTEPAVQEQGRLISGYYDRERKRAMRASNRKENQE